MLPTNQFGSFIWFIVGLIILLGGFIIRPMYMSIIMMVIGGLVIGLWRSAPYQGDYISAGKLIKTTATVSGVVKEDPRSTGMDKYSLTLDDIVINNDSFNGRLWVQDVYSDYKIARGDRILIEGAIGSGFGNYIASVSEPDLLEVFQYSKNDYALWVRDEFANNLRKVIADPAASLGLGFLVGEQNNLSDELTESLKIAGLTHIVVASGYNLTILVRFCRRLFENISKYIAALSSIFVIFAFISITGWSPSMTRAGLVAIISLAAWYYGRKVHPVVLLSVVAAITVIVNPTNAWGDLGWQLSFASFAGILILAPLLRSYFFGDKAENQIIRILIETTSAYLMTLPIIVLISGSISTVAIIANLLVLPLIPLAMGLTFITGIAATINIWTGQIIGWFTSLILEYVFWIANYLSSFNLAILAVSFNTFWSVAWYAGILVAVVYLKRVTKLRLYEVNIVQ